ncbi:MAG: 6-carboxytetrahydropterin synthase [Caldilineaceae bacterium]
MYTLAVQRDFVAQHFLIGGDWGPENQWHSHHYRLEVQLQGSRWINTVIWSTLWMWNTIWSSL